MKTDVINLEIYQGDDMEFIGGRKRRNDILLKSQK